MIYIANYTLPGGGDYRTAYPTRNRNPNDNPIIIDLNPLSSPPPSPVPDRELTPVNLVTEKKDEKKIQERFAKLHHNQWLRNFLKDTELRKKSAPRLKPLNDGTKVDIAVEFHKLHPEIKTDIFKGATFVMEALKLCSLTFSWCREFSEEYIHISWLRIYKMKFDEITDGYVVPFPLLNDDVMQYTNEVKFMMEIVSANNLIVKIVAEEFHQKLRESFEKSHPGQKQMKLNSDGTVKDINVPFGLLHDDWKRENYLAAHAARDICRLFPDKNDNEVAAEYLHEQWMFQNWHLRSNDNKSTYVPFAFLEQKHKDKCLDQVEAMRSKLRFDDVLITEAASMLHETWREQFDPEETMKKKIKKSGDGSIQNINVPFDELHFTWQVKNLEAAFDAKNACLKHPKRATTAVETSDDVAASMIHEAWMLRNEKRPWNATQHVPFDALSDKDKQKNREQVRIMREVIAKAQNSIVTSINPDSFRNWKGLGKTEFSKGTLLNIRELITAVCGDYSPWLESPSETSLNTPSVLLHRKPLTATEIDELLTSNDVKSLPDGINFTDPFNNSKFTLLHFAVRLGRLDVVEVLLKHGAKSCKSKNGFTPLTWAAYIGNADIVECLTKKSEGGFEPNLNTVDQGGWTALMWASFFGYIEIVKKLLKVGAKCDVEDNKDSWTALSLAVSRNHDKVAELLYEDRDDLLMKALPVADSRRHNLLHMSVNLSSPSEKTTTLYCIAKKFKAIIKSKFAKSIVHPRISVSKSQKLILSIRYILEISKSIDKSVNALNNLDEDLKTLQVPETSRSAYLSNKATLDENNATLRKFLYLLLREASTAKVLIDSDLLSELRELSPTERSLESLSEPVMNIVVAYKFQEFLNIEDDDGFTPIHIAAQRGLLEHVKLLIDFGADIEARSHAIINNSTAVYSKGTPIFYAAINGHADVVEYLLTKGSKFQNSASKEDSTTTAFREAAQMKQSDIISCLLKHPFIFDKDCDVCELNQDVYTIFKQFYNLLRSKLGLPVRHSFGDDYVQMLELSFQGVRDSEVEDGFKKFIHEYKPILSDYSMVTPYGKGKYKFSGTWNMFKDEYVTKGTKSLETGDIEYFWARQYLYTDRFFDCADFNNFLKGGGDSEVISFTIDIPYTSSRSYLKFFLSVDRGVETETLESMQDSDIFSNDLVKISVLHAWKKYGRHFHLVDSILFFLYLVLSSYTNYTFNRADNGTSGKALLLFEVILLVSFAQKWSSYYIQTALTLSLRLGAPSLLEGVYRRRGIYSFLNIFWYRVWRLNFWLEFFCVSWFSFAISSASLRLGNSIESDISSYCASVAAVMQYILAITYLRPLKNFGRLIGIIEGILWDIRYYLFVIFLIIFGFSQALYLISWSGGGSDDSYSFSTPGGSLAQGLTLFVGNPSLPITHATSFNESLSIFLAILLLGVGSILLLNLMIAKMNDTYTKMKDNDDTEWSRQLCSTISYQRYDFLILLISLYDEKKPDKFIHFLRRKGDVKNDDRK